MKKTKLVLAAMVQLICTAMYAQAPALINYQGAVRNASGTVMGDRTIAVKFELRQGSSTGTVVFTETHPNTITNKLGLFSTRIGTVTPTVTPLDQINWQA